MRFILFIFIFILTGPGDSDSPLIRTSDINSLMQATLSTQPMKHGQWSFCLRDAKSGKILFESNSQFALAPASGLKLLTSAAALDLLGSGYQFHTYLEYDGTISETGVLSGNIILHGQGDPSLGSHEMPGVMPMDSLLQFWVETILDAGTHNIDGMIICDDTWFDSTWLPGGWNWIDIGNYYGAGTSGLCLNENQYVLYFKPGKSEGDEAKVLRTEPQIPGLKFQNRMKTGAKGSGDNGYIYGGPLQMLRVLRGTVPAGVNEFSIKGSIPDPALFAGQSLQKALAAAGIGIGHPVQVVREALELPAANKKIVLADIASPPLSEIIFRLNKRSVNLYAEQLLKTLGKKEKHQGSTEAGVKTITEWLDEHDIGSEGLLLYDGSGLSRSNAVTTEMMTSLLAYMTTRPAFEVYYNSLAVAGDPDDIGFMKSVGRGTAAAMNVRAKTGLIDRVRSHSGYVRTRSGKLLCFSMIANNFTGSYRKIDRLHEKLMVALAELP